jgi:hypothetical protein
MKLINQKLYITYQEMVDCGVSENTLKKAKNRQSSSWTFINDPDDKRKVLIEYEGLKDEYKKRIEIRFGNPHEHVAKQPIRDLVKWDNKAEEFYLGYKYESGDVMQPLPIAHVKKYTAASSFLNMLKEVTEDKKALKDKLGLPVEKFYFNCLEIIEQDNIDLPTSYRRLLAKRKEYDTAGYECLISKKFGNQQAAKVNDEVSKASLLERIADPRQFDDVFVAMDYNIWANKNGYKEITSATVGVKRRSNNQDLVMTREGNAALKNKYLIQAKGFRPTAPLYLVENDDNVLDLLFNDPENPRAEKRYVAMVISDGFNDYPLGKAYAVAGTLNEGSSIQLIKAAYVDAMYHIRSITGAWYLPHETKSDKWGLKSLEPFYRSMGNYMITPVGSKNRGYIEQSFGTPHWKRCLKIGANNYSGNNISAKYRGVNTEWLASNKKERRLIGDEATEQIEGFFHRLRHLPQSNGVSKHSQWLEAFTNLPAEKKREISDEQFLLKFGIEHNPGVGKVNRISNRGVEPQIAGVRYSYNLDGNWRLHEGKAVKIIYDPYDMSRVLVTDYDKVRMMAYEPNLSARALADSYTNGRTFLNAVLQEKQDTVELIAEKNERRKKVLVEAGYDFEAVLQGGNMRKEVKQYAEQKMLERTININTGDDYLDQM